MNLLKDQKVLADFVIPELAFVELVSTIPYDSRNEQRILEAERADRTYYQKRLEKRFNI